MANAPHSKLHSQFARIESYGLYKSNCRAKGKSVSEKTTARGICGEAMRIDGFHQHIAEDTVLEPELIYGIDPYTKLLPAIENRFKQLQEVQKTLDKPALRKDMLVMCGGVFSYPHAEPDANFDNWQNDCLDYLKNKYGDKLQSVIVHFDENHPHMHFLLCDLDSLRVHGGLDPAKTVQYQHRTLKQHTGLSQVEAYKRWQDEFYNAVSIKHAHRRKLGVTHGRIYGKPKEVKRRIVRDQQAQVKLDLAGEIQQEAKELFHKANIIINIAENSTPDKSLDEAINNLNVPLWERTTAGITNAIITQIIPKYRTMQRENRILRNANGDYVRAKNKLDKAKKELDKQLAETEKLKNEATALKEKAENSLQNYRQIMQSAGSPNIQLKRENAELLAEIEQLQKEKIRADRLQAQFDEIEKNKNKRITRNITSKD